MKLLVVDESKAKKFILCVVEIDQEDVPTTRVMVKRLRMKGQRRVHLAKESEPRKREILSTFNKAKFMSRTYVAHGMSERYARELCLRQMVADLQQSEQYSIIFDADENHSANDGRVIRSALQKRGMLSQVEYRHQEPSAEVLLWIPDAIAWAYARGGVWRKQISDLQMVVWEIH